MKILFKFPSRSRPGKFIEAIQNITNNVSINNPYKFHILASLDNDDESFNEHYKEILTYLLQNDFIQIVYGKSNNKIHAVNRDMEKAPKDWDILIVMSDDMKFIVKGFDDIIRADMLKYFPDLDGVLHYNDGNQRENVMTMSIMGRKYYERTLEIYPSIYESVWCDVEETDRAHMLGKYRYMGDDNIIFNHLHPAWGLAQYDEQYRKTEDGAIEARDKTTFILRRAINYGLNPKEIVNPTKYPHIK